MIRVLFVDDEPKILRGLRRTLFSMRKEWDMQFAEKGADALALMEERDFDVLVTDMRMPEMTGNELLAIVQEKFPRTARIVLSGHADRSMLLECAKYAHQFLNKPCDEADLKGAVERACFLRTELEDDRLRSLASKLTPLPSLPTLYNEVIEEITSPDGTMESVGKILAKDVGMTAKILQLVNSAFFGLPQHVSGVGAAAGLLGMDTIKALVLSTQIFDQVEPNRLLPIETLWDHSTRVAAFSRTIARMEEADTQLIDHAFFSGMLHDIGKLVLYSEMEEEYSKIVRLHTGVAQMPVWTAEKRIIGADHAMVGSYLLNMWGLPSPVVEAVLSHHMPMRSPKHSFSALTAVHVANAIECDMFGRNAKVVQGELDPEYLEFIGLQSRVPEWRAACEEMVQEEKAA